MIMQIQTAYQVKHLPTMKTRICRTPTYLTTKIAILSEMHGLVEADRTLLEKKMLQRSTIRNVIRNITSSSQWRHKPPNFLLILAALLIVIIAASACTSPKTTFNISSYALPADEVPEPWLSEGLTVKTMYLAKHGKEKYFTSTPDMTELRLKVVFNSTLVVDRVVKRPVCAGWIFPPPHELPVLCKNAITIEIDTPPVYNMVLGEASEGFLYAIVNYSDNTDEFLSFDHISWRSAGSAEVQDRRGIKYHVTVYATEAEVSKIMVLSQRFSEPKRGIYANLIVHEDPERIIMKSLRKKLKENLSENSLVYSSVYINISGTPVEVIKTAKYQNGKIRKVWYSAQIDNYFLMLSSSSARVLPVGRKVNESIRIDQELTETLFQRILKHVLYVNN